MISYQSLKTCIHNLGSVASPTPFYLVAVDLSKEHKRELQDVLLNTKDTYPFEVYIRGGAHFVLLGKDEELGEKIKQYPEYIFCPALEILVENTDTIHQSANDILKECLKIRTSIY